MGGSKISVVLLSIVLFSGTSSGEFGHDPAQAVAVEREEVAWVMSREGDGGGLLGFRETFYRVGPPPPPLSPPWPI